MMMALLPRRVWAFETASHRRDAGWRHPSGDPVRFRVAPAPLEGELHTLALLCRLRNAPRRCAPRRPPPELAGLLQPHPHASSTLRHAHARQFAVRPRTGEGSGRGVARDAVRARRVMSTHAVGLHRAHMLSVFRVMTCTSTSTCRCVSSWKSEPRERDDAIEHNLSKTEATSHWP
jgi:hypothetical protein